MKTFRQYLDEKTKSPIEPFRPNFFKNKKQFNAIAKNRDFDIYFSPGFKKIFVRKDHNPFWDNTYWVSNQDTKHVIKYDLSKNGKIFGYTVYKKDGNVLSIIKTVGEQ